MPEPNTEPRPLKVTWRPEKTARVPTGTEKVPVGIDMLPLPKMVPLPLHQRAEGPWVSKHRFGGQVSFLARRVKPRRMTHLKVSGVVALKVPFPA